MSSGSTFAPALVDAIVADAARHWEVPIAAILGRDRLLRARFAAVWVAREATGAGFIPLGRCLGDRDHATIMNAHRRAIRLRETDATFREETDRLLAAARARRDA